MARNHHYLIFLISETMKKLIKFLVALTLLLSNNTYAAEPSISDVYEAAVVGDMDKANLMIAEVISKHPNSSKAHYVFAQLLAKQEKIDLAKSELAKAEELDPKISDIKEEAVIELKDYLNNYKQQD